MLENDLSGSATLPEIAKYYGVSTKTMTRRLKKYRHFFEFSQRKQIYFEKELQFIKKVYGERRKGQVETADGTSS